MLGGWRGRIEEAVVDAKSRPVGRVRMRDMEGDRPEQQGVTRVHGVMTRGIRAEIGRLDHGLRPDGAVPAVREAAQAVLRSPAEADHLAGRHISSRPC